MRSLCRFGARAVARREPAADLRPTNGRAACSGAALTLRRARHCCSVSDANSLCVFCFPFAPLSFSLAPSLCSPSPPQTTRRCCARHVCGCLRHPPFTFDAGAAPGAPLSPPLPATLPPAAHPSQALPFAARARAAQARGASLVSFPNLSLCFLSPAPAPRRPSSSPLPHNATGAPPPPLSPAAAAAANPALARHEAA